MLFLATETIWNSIDSWNYKRLFFEFYEISVGVSVITYFFQSNDYVSLAKITKWAIIFLFITAIMSIISSAIDPMYARNLTALSAMGSEKEAILGFKRIGGGTYSTAGAFMCLLPILIYYYKSIKYSFLSKKQIIIFSIIIFLALFGMQIFGNILIGICFSIIALMGMRKLRQSVLIVSIFLIIMLSIPQKAYVNSLLSISNYFKEDSDINFKFRDLSVFIESDADIDNNMTSTGSRLERYPILFKTFIKRPLLGGYFFSDESGNGYKREGAHLYWMNKLTITGIIGLFFFIIIPYNFIKSNLKYFNSAYKFYYILASLSVLSYGLIKVIGGRDTWYAFFIILPGLYYLPLLKKDN